MQRKLQRKLEKRDPLPDSESDIAGSLEAQQPESEPLSEMNPAASETASTDTASTDKEIQ